MEKTVSETLAEVLIEGAIDAIRNTMEGLDLQELLLDGEFLFRHAIVANELLGFNFEQSSKLISVAFSREAKARGVELSVPETQSQQKEN